MDHVFVLGHNPAVAFAVREFARYARKIAAVSMAAKSVAHFLPDTDGVWLGTVPDFDHAKWNHLKQSDWDDGFAIRQRGEQLCIAGANGRSVLFGVYAYLERLGARWVRPGSRGEWLPAMSGLPQSDFYLTESASYRHRGVCIEGSPSLEHVLGMVDWMAKRRMNSFFLQFHHSGTFWDRWYSRGYNPLFGEASRLTEKDFYELDTKVIDEVKRRGMLLHQVGHGWTAATLDMPCNSWKATDREVDSGQRRWIAKVNGKRELFDHIPVNTELCYSYAPAFRALLANIIAYAKSHPGIDVLHVWLSDAMNNKCECKHCSAMSPADWYVKLVNALSEQLYLIDPDRRFVFLSYFESWWSPKQMTVDSRRGNAILMFAPISRCFRHALADDACQSSSFSKRPALNEASMPDTNKPFLDLLQQWWKVYRGDSFLFDYHLWSGLHIQACDVTLARILHGDLQSLHALGLNGFVSCQVLRSFWPTGLPMTAMASTLWNRRTHWKELKTDYLRTAYGDDADWVDGYLSKLEKMILVKPEHGNSARLESRQTKELRAIEAYLQANHKELVTRAGAAAHPLNRESLELLVHHNLFLLMTCQASMGKLERHDVKTWLLKSERRVHPYLDIPALMASHGLV